MIYIAVILAFVAGVSAKAFANTHESVFLVVSIVAAILTLIALYLWAMIELRRL